MDEYKDAYEKERGETIPPVIPYYPTIRHLIDMEVYNNWGLGVFALKVAEAQRNADKKYMATH